MHRQKLASPVPRGGQCADDTTLRDLITVTSNCSNKGGMTAYMSEDQTLKCSPFFLLSLMLSIVITVGKRLLLICTPHMAHSPRLRGLRAEPLASPRHPEVVVHQGRMHHQDVAQSSRRSRGSTEHWETDASCGRCTQGRDAALETWDAGAPEAAESATPPKATPQGQRGCNLPR